MAPDGGHAVPAAMAKSLKNLKFEDAMKRLDDIVEAMEAAQTSRFQSQTLPQSTLALCDSALYCGQVAYGNKRREQSVAPTLCSQQNFNPGAYNSSRDVRLPPLAAPIYLV